MPAETVHSVQVHPDRRAPAWRHHRMDPMALTAARAMPRLIALLPLLAASHGLWIAVQLSEGSRTMIGARGRVALCLGYLLLVASTASGALEGAAGAKEAGRWQPARHPYALRQNGRWPCLQALPGGS